MKKTGKLVAAGILFAGSIQAEYVIIGGEENTDDTAGYGGVNYEYKIHKTEVTAAKWAAFYNDAGSGKVGSFNSNYKSWRVSGPAVNISYHEAAQYCNWLTTGDATRGVYTINSSGLVTAVDRTRAENTYTTYYAVPTEDEWYKAAYWTGSGYSLYADGTNTPPNAGAGGWNYNNVNTGVFIPWASGSSALEQNGTHDIMGNVWEWLEDNSGVIRGGADYSNEINLRSSFRWTASSSTTKDDRIGFRPVQLSGKWVPIGGAGNAADTAGLGAVAHEYSIKVTEVTIREWDAFYNDTNSNRQGMFSNRYNHWVINPDNGKGKNNPVVRINYHDAAQYCNWLTSGDARQGVYRIDSSGSVTAIDRAGAETAYITYYAIPTEDEWYKAAYWTGSGYSLYADGTSLPVAIIPNRTGWNYGNGRSQVWKAGGSAPEQNGTYDMLGNVWEWLEDSSGAMRGGDYRTDERFLRNRVEISLTQRFTDIGLRLVQITTVPFSDIKVVDAAHVVVSWTSKEGAQYALQHSTSLTSGFETVLSNIEGAPPENTVTNSIDASGRGYYRILLNR